MPYYTDKEDYTPRYAIGDTVRVSGMTDSFVATITGRKVTRNKNRCDTYYTFDNGRSAYEWALESTTYRRDPGNWADNIVGRYFHMHPYCLSVEGGHASLWVEGSKGRARIIAKLQDDGRIESIGSHSVIVTFNDGTEKGGAYDNLGETIVAVSNAIR